MSASEHTVVDAAIAARPVLAVTSGAPRAALVAHLSAALATGGVAALEATADEAVQARAALVLGSAR